MRAAQLLGGPGRVVAELVPEEAEVHGLVALMEIQASRARARVTLTGEPILLLDQDRSRWDQLLIRRGLAALAHAEARARPLVVTTLDGRLDDPAAFVSGVDDKQYEVIDRRFEAFDSILIGTNTYAEMHAYRSGALTDDTGFVNSNAVINQRMAKKMNDYRKCVITRKASPPEREWHNAENVVAHNDDALAGFVADLKAQPGKNVHLAGGVALASEFVRLGLVDEYRFMVYQPRLRDMAFIQSTQGIERLRDCSRLRKRSALTRHSPSVLRSRVSVLEMSRVEPSTPGRSRFGRPAPEHSPQLIPTRKVRHGQTHRDQHGWRRRPGAQCSDSLRGAQRTEP